MLLHDGALTERLNADLSRRIVRRARAGEIRAALVAALQKLHLAKALGDETNRVLRVRCSLWRCALQVSFVKDRASDFFFCRRLWEEETEAERVRFRVFWRTAREPRGYVTSGFHPNVEAHHECWCVCSSGDVYAAFPRAGKGV